MPLMPPAPSGQIAPARVLTSRAMSDPLSPEAAARALPHRNAPTPLHFPSEAEMPETLAHLVMRTLLFQMLSSLLKGVASVGSEQFVYFNARDPRRCLAPDAFVKIGGGQDLFPIWKTWERGSPELCVEIASESDDVSWETKLSRYHEMGVRELVRFDPRQAPGERLAVWDRIDDVLVERDVEGEATPCVTLALHWVLRPAERLECALRIARDAAGTQLVPTLEEARVIEMEARESETRAREDETRARESETHAREAAERRVAELEEALRRALSRS